MSAADLVSFALAVATTSTSSPGVGCCPLNYDYCGRALKCSDMQDDTLYSCSAGGANPVIKESCSSGCIDGGRHRSDFCAAMPAGSLLR